MQQRAREMGTLDGTPVTPYTSFHEDQFHADALNRLSQRAAGRVMDEARQARPQEFNRLQRNEAQLQEFLRSREEQGQFYSPSQINRMRAEGIEGLYQEGQLGQGIGQANREYLELLEAWERSEANQQFKYGAGPLEGLPPRSYSESPFNPRREAAPPPQERVAEQKPRPSEQQLKEVRRWEPPVQQKTQTAAAEKKAEVPAQKPATQQAQARTQAQAATQKPEAQKPAEKPYDPNKDSNALYKAMHGGLTGLGTDEEALFKALDGKSKDQIDKLKANYKDHYGRDLDKDLQSELSGKDYQRARSLMQGKQSSADATALRQAIEGVGTDEKAVFKTLEGKSAEQRQAIQQEYKRQTGRELSSDIKSDFSGAEKDRADALLSGNKARADAATLQDAMKGMGTDEATIMQTLQGKSAQERAALSKAYKEQYGVDLSTRLKGDLSGAELDQAKALLEGNQAKAAAAQIKTAAAGLGSDEASINQALEGKSAEERQAIAQAYRQQYGKELSVELKGELSGNDLQKSQALLARGKLSEAEQLKFALEGAGTDEEAVKSALQGKSKEDVARIRADYERLTGRQLDGDVASDMSGRELFDTRQDLKGRAETVDEAVARANEVHQFERGGESNAVGRGLVDLFSDKGELLDRNTQRINESKARFDQLVGEGRLEEAEVEKQRMRELTGFQTADVGTYREAKDSAADTAGTVAATAAGVAVVVASAGTATPLVAVAAMSATAGAGARVVTSGLIQGEGYGWESAASDAARGAIDGGTSVIGAGTGKAATSAGKALAQEATEQTVGRRIVSAGAQGIKDGLVGGAVGAGASEAVADGTWDNGLGDGLKRVAGATALGAGTGAVMGGAVGGGMVAGKEAAVGLSKAGHEVADGLRNAADQASTRLRTATQEAGEKFRTFADDVRTSTRETVADLKRSFETPEVQTRQGRGMEGDIIDLKPEDVVVVKTETVEQRQLLLEGGKPEVKAEVPEAKAQAPEVKAPEVEAQPPEIKAATAEVQAQPPEIPQNPPELKKAGGGESRYQPAEDWVDDPTAQGTMRRRVVDGDGNSWTEIIDRTGTRFERTVAASDGGPAWTEVDKGWGIDRTRTVKATDGGSDWHEVEFNGRTQRTRTSRASDGGPDWSESEYNGRLSRSREVPDSDGKGAWHETDGDAGHYKSRSYTDDKGSWSETIHGENRWRYREGGASGLQREAKKMGQATVRINGPEGPLDVKIYGEASPKHLKMIEQALNDAPPGARKFGQEIYLNRDLGEVMNKAGRVESGVGGIGGDGRVIMNLDCIDDPKALRDILYHEMGHNADYGSGTLSKNKDIWGGTSVSAYGGLNAAEDFAEVHGTVLGGWKRYENLSAKDWANEALSKKKMEIVKMYGGKVPSAEELAAAQKSGPFWKNWFGSRGGAPATPPPGGGGGMMGGMLGGIDFDRWFSAVDQSSLSRMLGLGEGPVDPAKLRQLAKTKLFGMTSV